ncbi:MAG: YIP1 family protein [Peptostreptococcaceae bacterium]|nr:YIP1 family protein [Peptostreptococcaceae bacterium]
MNYNTDVGIAENIFDLFFAPRRLAERIKEKPQFLIPIAIIVLIAILSNFVIKELSFQAQIDAIKETTPYVSVESLRAQYERGFWLALIFAPLTVILLCAVSSGVYWGASRIFGGVGDFAPTFSVMLYSFVITSLGSLIQYFMANATNNLMFSFSPAVLLDIKTANPWLYNLLTLVNPVHIFVLTFLVITLQVINEYSRKNAVLTVAVVTIAKYLLTSVITMLFSQNMLF